jgi:hypothetical protein
MPTNIEKLAEELSAIVAPYPNPLDCNSATISSEGGKLRIVMDHWMGPSFKFTFDFKKALPFDPAGGKGKTNDVFAGVKISVSSPHGGGNPTKEEVDRYCALYLRHVHAVLREEARAGRISSKTLAEMQVSAPPEDDLSAAAQDMIAINPKHIVDATSAETVEEFIDIVQKGSPELADALRRDHGLDKKRPRKPRKK